MQDFRITKQKKNKKIKRLYAEDEADITYRSFSQIVKYIEKL